jgi:hypothetical protein
MPETTARTCTQCGTYVPGDSFTCPQCGTYFKGGFALADLIEGMRTPDPDVIQLPPPSAEEAEAESDSWLPPPPPTFNGRRVDLPHIVPPTEFPYASDEKDDEPEEAVTGLRRLVGRRSGGRH